MTGLYVLFRLYFLAVCFDFVTGVVASAKEGKLKSRTCSNGIFRTIGELMLLMLMVSVALMIEALHGIMGTLMLAVLVKEGISIVENLSRLDVWLPDWLKKTLAVNLEKYNEGDGK